MSYVRKSQILMQNIGCNTITPTYLDKLEHNVTISLSQLQNSQEYNTSKINEVVNLTWKKKYVAILKQDCRYEPITDNATNAP